MREVGRKQGTVSPCAACKLLRRRCAQDCIFAPYFPADEPQKFANVHKVFGASNVSKLLQELPAHHRSDAVSSLVYEANARVRDPVYGCVGAISSLQRQIESLQTQLAVAQAEMVRLRMRHATCLAHLGSRTHTTALGTASASTTGSSSMASPKQQLIAPDQHAPKSVFALDMVIVDQTSLGEPPIWSC
ncbi:LOB domain-containing protein 4 isoform X2 [Elaeis guineensis]|uniref:LOB domain-containing protein 4 isoform X2 n=1 Tax=Elaeis guineensis var. tenera TaxID=51953 RepID=A0A6I9SG32_ELAGV|nr:LOB domain-containing protein 4 isoform X2 [Elaeis guineensis]